MQPANVTLITPYGTYDGALSVQGGSLPGRLFIRLSTRGSRSTNTPVLLATLLHCLLRALGVDVSNSYGTTAGLGDPLLLWLAVAAGIVDRQCASSHPAS